jgi:cysteine desulfurase/selenocysteine lyase
VNREDFKILNSDLVYLDNGATTMKPQVVVDAVVDYYTKYTANAHRGDYQNSLKVDEAYEGARAIVRDFINANKSDEIIFTYGCTDSLNRVVFGYFKNKLQKDDEVIITLSEHASNALPWFELGCTVKYIPLTSDYHVTLDNLKKVITDKTKVISIAHITNTIGDVRPVKEIIKYAHEHNILVVLDAAQSIAHIKIDVQDLDVDFLAFSGHKIYGPTGIGVLYGKEKLLEELKPIFYGGDMNSEFSSDGTRSYHELPSRDEAGTQNIAGAIGLGSAIQYVQNIGLDKIHEHEMVLRDYLVSELQKNNNIEIYNPKADSGIVLFNYKGVFSQDLAIYLDKYHICVRAGNHCAKMLKETLGIKNTCRISLGLYNDKSDCDKLIKALNNPNLKNEII